MPATLIRPGDRTNPTGADWTIKHLLRRGGVGVVWGPPGGGKSTLLVDLLAHVATGRTWRV